MDSAQLILGDAAAKILPPIGFAEYCDIPAVNISTLLKFLGRTDAGAKWTIENEKPETDALLVGHACHAAILEPEVFDKSYCTMPDFGDLRVKVNKEAKNQWYQEHADLVCLSPEQAAMVLSMRENLARCDDPEMRELFDGKGQNEVTLLFRDAETNTLCKARVDRLTTLHGYPVMVELKTARAISNRGIETTLGERHYHIRMAWYMDALNLMRPADWMVIYVWLGNEEAYEVRATQCDDVAYAEGRAAWRHCLDRYARCVSTGQWPSYQNGIEVVNPPRWAYRFTSPEA